MQVGGEGKGCGEEERATTGVTDVPSVPVSVTGRPGDPRASGPVSSALKGRKGLDLLFTQQNSFHKLDLNKELL